MPTNYLKFTAAAVQAPSAFVDAPDYFDSARTLKTATDCIREAGGNGARLVVFPETWLPGFPFWSIDMHKGPEWVNLWAEYLAHSIEVPGPEIESLCEAARSAKTHVAIGINERDAFYPGRMHNSIVFISDEGRVLGTHRKICITLNEQLYHTRGDGGANLAVHETPIGRLSGLICGEHYQPLLKHHLIAQGAQVNCSLWPGFKGGAEELMQLAPVMTQAACATGGFWGVLAGTYIPPEQVPGDFYSNHALDMTFGGSCIINPFGEIVAGPAIEEETIVYGEIDLRLNAMAKSVINLTGSYGRWDILNLNVREESYRPEQPMETDRPRSVSELEQQVATLQAEIEALRSAAKAAG